MTKKVRRKIRDLEYRIESERAVHASICVSTMFALKRGDNAAVVSGMELSDLVCKNITRLYDKLDAMHECHKRSED